MRSYEVRFIKNIICVYFGVTMSGAGVNAVKSAAKAVHGLTLRQKIWDAMSAWTLRNAGFQQLGLRREDLYDEGDWDVKEAIRRLPEKETNLRIYRIRRAMDLSLKHRVLPREQWTKPEEDIFYLTPYLREVVKEAKEKKKWKNM